MAIKSQGTNLAVATAAGSAKTITGATSASPVVITSTSHGLVNGTVVVLSGFTGGMTELNGRAFVVSATATNTFTLAGVDGSAYSTYSSGGTATPQTMTTVSAETGLSGFDGKASEIDTTDLLSVAKTYVLGLQDFGNVSLKVFLVTDAGQSKLLALKNSAASAAFSITLSDGRISAFIAFVSQFTFDVGGPDSAVSGAVTLRVTGLPQWFA